MSSHRMVLSSLALASLSASAAGLVPVSRTSVTAPAQTISQPLTDSPAPPATEAMQQATAYSQRMTGSSGEWMPRGPSVTLPDGRVLAINRGGVDVLYLSDLRVVVTRYGQITSLDNAQTRGWLTVHPAPLP